MSDTIDINNQEAIKKYLDNAINRWRIRYNDANYERDELIASCYVDAFQSVRVSLFGELLK